MAITRDAVIWGYRYFLGRDPESEEVIGLQMTHEDETAFVNALLSSREFQRSRRFKKFIHPNSSLAPSEGIAPFCNNYLCSTNINILLVGNCQVWGLARLIQALTGEVKARCLQASPKTLERLQGGQHDELIASADIILLHPVKDLATIVELRNPSAVRKIRMIPRIEFAAFHPDIVYINTNEKKSVLGRMGQYQSSIAFYGWKHGLNVEETKKLFREDVFEHLGFFNYWDIGRESLLNEGRQTQIPLEHFFDQWSKLGAWMHSMNHPKLFVLADLTRKILTRDNIPSLPLPAVEHLVHDNLSDSVVWPVYPEIANKLGVEGWYGFKLAEVDCPDDRLCFIGLDNFLHSSFELFSQFSETELKCPRLETPPYQELRAFLNEQRSFKPLPTSAIGHGESEPSTTSPYADLADHQFWRRIFPQQSINAVDPVVRASPDFRFKRNQKIATAGSCFAQHISRTLQQEGFQYYIAEQDQNLDPATAVQRQYGVFSARYGNIYNARQLLQLFDRAYGNVTPRDQCWLRSDGRFIDPFRPRIEPKGFSSPESVENDREQHLAAVRDLFKHLDIFVFTLGLTEAWRNASDGMVFPLAPGVVATRTSADSYEFINFDVADVVADLRAFCQRLSGINPNARMILTVSPVPLIATYENRHVLVSTTASKAILRAAAEKICATHRMCEYFPAYEIITGSYTRGRYFEGDLRSVAPEGVDHVMRLFLRHYSREQDDNTAAARKYTPPLTDAFAAAVRAEHASFNDIICDEEVIDGE